LIAEDNSDLRDMIAASILRDCPFAFDFAVDGADALARYQAARTEQWAYDLLVLDNQMPEHTGIEILETVRAGGDEKTPVALFTCYLENADQERARRAGILGVWQKPDGIIDLKQRIMRALRLSEQSAVFNLSDCVRPSVAGRMEGTLA
jgi:CheY-like chemotaxis protein